jgi:hypothetical protein
MTCVKFECYDKGPLCRSPIYNSCFSWQGQAAKIKIIIIIIIKLHNFLSYVKHYSGRRAHDFIFPAKSWVAKDAVQPQQLNFSDSNWPFHRGIAYLSLSLLLVSTLATRKLSKRTPLAATSSVMRSYDSCLTDGAQLQCKSQLGANPNPPSQLPLWEETMQSAWRKPTTFGRALTNSLHEVYNVVLSRTTIRNPRTQRWKLALTIPPPNHTLHV